MYIDDQEAFCRTITVLHEQRTSCELSVEGEYLTEKEMDERGLDEFLKLMISLSY
jgi:hypothetical protein